MNNQAKFKAGDLVYCPNLTSDILTLKHTIAYQESKKKLDSIPFFVFELSYSPFGWSGSHKFLSAVNEYGCRDSHQSPVIFHANQQNYELLSQLYPNITFEQPPKKKRVISGKS